MRGHVKHHGTTAHSAKPLVVRAGIARTFGGLVGFIVVTFLCTGIYILEDAFANPLNNGAVAVITAAFILTIAAILLFFLIKPDKGPGTAARHHSAHHHSLRSARSPEPPSPHLVARAKIQDHSRNSLAYQRFYVDHSRIRP